MDNMKKIIGLVLVVVLVAVLCVAFARRAASETNDLRIRFVNETGTELTKITLRERIGTLHQEWVLSDLADGGESEIMIKTVIKDGNPNLDFLYTSGSTMYQTMIFDKGDKTITFRLDAGSNVITDVVSQQS